MNISIFVSMGDAIEFVYEKLVLAPETETLVSGGQVERSRRVITRDGCACSSLPPALVDVCSGVALGAGRSLPAARINPFHDSRCLVRARFVGGHQQEQIALLQAAGITKFVFLHNADTNDRSEQRAK